MAEILDDDLPAKPRGSYPWNEWLDGRTRLLVAGEDFNVQATSMRTMCYVQAHKRDLKVTTELVGPLGGESIKVRAWKP